MKNWLRYLAILCISTIVACTPAGEKATVDEAPQEKLVPSADAPVAEPWVPGDFEVPVLVENTDFKIVPLGPAVKDIDYEAYMSSIEHLQKTFTRSTSWPHEGLTNDDAILDMETEQSRFEKRESFAYAVLTPDGTRERGCVYVYPSSKPGYDAMVRLWVTKDEFDAGFDEELYSWVTQWIESQWPFETIAYPGRSIAWEVWDEMPEV